MSIEQREPGKIVADTVLTIDGITLHFLTMVLVNLTRALSPQDAVRLVANARHCAAAYVADRADRR